MAEFNISHIANPIKLEGVKVTPDGKLETTATVNATINVDSVNATDVSIIDGTDPSIKLALTPDGSVKTSMSTALDKDYDSIDVGKMTKGGVTTTHDAVAVGSTSAEIDCVGFNAVALHIDIVGTGSWKCEVLNSLVTNGSFVEAYEGTKQLTTGDLTKSRCVTLTGNSDFIKLKLSEITDGSTCTVKVQPLNV